MSKHTNGPWIASCDSAQCASVKMSDGFEFYTGGEEQDIDTIDANTSLIASAPELLSALEGIIESHMRGMGQTEINLRIDKGREIIARLKTN